MSSKPEISDQDLSAAREREADETHEKSLLLQGSSLGFWDNLVRSGVLSSAEKSLFMDWINLYTEKHSVQDFFLESGDVFANSVCKILNLHAMNEYKDQVDLALIVICMISQHTNEYSQLFAQVCVKHFNKALENATVKAFYTNLQTDIAHQRAQAAAAAAEAQISGHQAAISSVNSPTHYTAEDLSKYGELHDGGFFGALLALISKENAAGFTQRAAIFAACSVAVHMPVDHVVQRHVVRKVLRCVREIGGNTLLTSLKALKVILKRRATHYAFVKENGVEDLLMVLKRDGKYMQPLYLAGFCIWLLSYEDSNDVVFHKLKVVAVLVALAKSANREKVVRIALSVLCNLRTKDSFVEEMIGADMNRVLSSLAQRKWKDEDISSYVTQLQEVLQSKISDLSNYEMYKAEVVSGVLRRSPVHTEKFWRAHCLKFDDDNFGLIKAVVSMLASDNSEIVEMACYDLGEFARFHPDGKSVLTKLDAKNRLMALMTHSDQQVSKAALLAVQKILIHKWDVMVSNVKAPVK